MKIASLDQEAEHDEQHGWKRYTPGEPKAAPENALTPRRRRKEPDADDHQRPD
jgi:hypothetical protein